MSFEIYFNIKVDLDDVFGVLQEYPVYPLLPSMSFSNIYVSRGTWLSIIQLQEYAEDEMLKLSKKY